MEMAGNTKRFFDVPHGMAQLLLGVNILVFALCVSQSGGANFSTEMLFRYGAMYSQALDRHEYWRLVAYGFLHGNPIHLLANMLCLVLWGGLLERRVEALYFTLIYLGGLVFGGIVSNLAHPGPYLSVGASGAISAILGALLCLRILGRIGLPWNFFAINIGLNVMIAVGASRVDWQAHLGGFVAGMVTCACLDLIEKTTAWWLRCKFPEFVKMNAFIAFAVVVAYCWAKPIVSLQQAWVFPVASAIAGLIFIKVLDVMLSIKRGLAAVVVVFALTNAILVLLLARLFDQALVSACLGQRSSTSAMAGVLAKACENMDLSISLAAMSALAFTLLLYWPQFARGLADVGFVGASLRGERARRWGI
jgi:membrane associated rhomboid family serine protease